MLLIGKNSSCGGSGFPQILAVGRQGLQVDLVLIRLVDMGFNGMFSYSCCGYTEPTGGSFFNLVGGHGFQWDVLRSSLGIQGLPVDLVLIRLVDMGFNGMFSDSCCGYTEPTCGSIFNLVGGHGFQWDVLRFLL